MKRKYLSLAIGVVLVAPAMPAWSQEEAGGSPAEVKATQLDTVTVTARKREETLQDVPVAGFFGRLWDAIVMFFKSL